MTIYVVEIPGTRTTLADANFRGSRVVGEEGDLEGVVTNIHQADTRRVSEQRSAGGGARCGYLDSAFSEPLQ
jgi:hypothetical protein